MAAASIAWNTSSSANRSSARSFRCRPHSFLRAFFNAFSFALRSGAAPRGDTATLDRGDATTADGSFDRFEGVSVFSHAYVEAGSARAS